ncbi:hypothetical protein L6452_41402 [Arctium lappa]|uniref:Uncharacterized protein n=1 Tax=Arctium lappa TaxID=4217 RepID=A0ACB8XPT2_ARCLA|nr:hypothetical protein L6452_41402 [Arctium lappa]
MELRKKMRMKRWRKGVKSINARKWMCRDGGCAVEESGEALRGGRMNNIVNQAKFSKNEKKGMDVWVGTMGYPIASREKQFLDGSSKLVLTFEDKGDQMPVGDVPWSLVMGSLQESLNRFKKQQEKCQSTLKSVAGSKTTTKTTTGPPPPHRVVPASTLAKSPLPAVKFSNDTERLQHINNIRKIPVGAQIKRVIDLLFERRCGACTYNNKNSCKYGCVFAQYFPTYTSMQEFGMLHQVFHNSNVERMILSTPAARVPELIECLIYEAD